MPLFLSIQFKAMNKEHIEAVGSGIPLGGHPDTGSGRYSALLPYKDWLAFNNAQRGEIRCEETTSMHLVLL